MNKTAKAIVVILSLVLVCAGAVFLYFYVQTAASNPTIETTEVSRRDLEELVSVTGRVQPTTKVDLAFESTGKISLITVDVGDKVSSGESIVSLDRTDLNLELSRAMATLENEKATLVQLQAALSVETATLNELTRGTRQEDIQIAQTKLTNAEKSLQNAEIQLANAISTADQDLENAYDGALDVLNDIIVDYNAVMTLYTDEFFVSTTASEGELVYPTTNLVLETEIKQLRSANNKNILALETAVSNIQNTEDIESILLTAKENLRELTTYLNKLNASLSDSVGLTEDEKNTFQTNINTSRLAVAAEQTAISTKMQEISSQKIANTNAIDRAESDVITAENAVLLAKDELLLKQAGNTTETIQSQQAKVDQANANITAQDAKIRASQAQVNLIQDQIGDRILKSPIDGIVTKVDVEPGEIVSPNQILVSIISEGTLEVEANIPEVDIAKLSIGNLADITLDAYGSDINFPATVVTIDPAETIVEGVPTYAVTFQFVNEDDRVKSGMTANIDVMTATSTNVIAVPQRSILFENGSRFARIYENGEVIRKQVETGLLSWDGLIEITSGLSEGEQIVTFIEDAS